MGNRHACCSIMTTCNYEREDKENQPFNPWEGSVDDEEILIHGFVEECTEYKWDGPADSDDEIAEFINDRTPWEVSEGVKFSKNGLV